MAEGGWLLCLGAWHDSNDVRVVHDVKAGLRYQRHSSQNAANDRAEDAEESGDDYEDLFEQYLRRQENDDAATIIQSRVRLKDAKRRAAEKKDVGPTVSPEKRTLLRRAAAQDAKLDPTVTLEMLKAAEALNCGQVNVRELLIQAEAASPFAVDEYVFANDKFTIDGTSIDKGMLGQVILIDVGGSGHIVFMQHKCIVPNSDFCYLRPHEPCKAAAQAWEAATDEEDLRPDRLFACRQAIEAAVAEGGTIDHGLLILADAIGQAAFVAAEGLQRLAGRQDGQSEAGAERSIQLETMHNTAKTVASLATEAEATPEQAAQAACAAVLKLARLLKSEPSDAGDSIFDGLRDTLKLSPDQMVEFTCTTTQRCAVIADCDAATMAVEVGEAAGRAAWKLGQTAAAASALASKKATSVGGEHKDAVRAAGSVAELVAKQSASGTSPAVVGKAVADAMLAEGAANSEAALQAASAAGRTAVEEGKTAIEAAIAAAMVAETAGAAPSDMMKIAADTAAEVSLKTQAPLLAACKCVAGATYQLAAHAGKNDSVAAQAAVQAARTAGAPAALGPEIAAHAAVEMKLAKGSTPMEAGRAAGTAARALGATLAEVARFAGFGAAKAGVAIGRSIEEITKAAADVVVYFEATPSDAGPAVASAAADAGIALELHPAVVVHQAAAAVAAVSQNSQQAARFLGKAAGRVAAAQGKSLKEIGQAAADAARVSGGKREDAVDAACGAVVDAAAAQGVSAHDVGKAVADAAYAASAVPAEASRISGVAAGKAALAAGASAVAASKLTVAAAEAAGGDLHQVEQARLEVLDSAEALAPEVLRVHAPRLQGCSGVYELMQDGGVNGHPVWRQKDVETPNHLFSSTEGRWVIAGTKDFATTTRGAVMSSSMHGGVMPHCLDPTEWAGLYSRQGYSQDPGIRITEKKRDKVTISFNLENVNMDSLDEEQRALVRSMIAERLAAHTRLDISRMRVSLSSMPGSGS
eukprot:TRINITY_DN36839_c0_g2_i1.p1 TRINITY_DN36839_c0_g2~~TRINITY_DN36839_c0_g2_i1.p1  ORF type:complete len:1133 (-),score=292.18 TRINITY_DN36839_c0_g2_i1:674-3622(-)